MKVTLILLGALCEVIVGTKGQSNARTVLSPFLMDCYSDSWLVNRNNLPPMTLSVMLDIIRKIEDHPNSIGGMRQIATGIVQKFRQDGIVYDPTAASSQNIVPYSPTGFPAYKNRLLLTKLIPNNQFNLPREAITLAEKCALHHMVSSSLYIHTRGDEEWTCDSLTTTDRNARMRQYEKGQDVEVFDVKGTVDRLGRQILGVSRCPIETGVVSTPWGQVSMGPVITGISSGLEEQNVLVTDLVTVRSGFEVDGLVVNNRYASTLSGDIAEAALRQGTSLRSPAVGAGGGWNSTNARRHYFVNKNNDLEFTDAEIRGDLDGLILSELGIEYVNKFPDFRLSQLVDMFYSDNGILHETRFRACNRKVLVPDIAARQTLIERSLGPAIALYHVSTLSGTVDMRGIQNFINSTVDAFHTYIPQNINDPLCNVTNNQVIRPKVNLILITEPITARTQIISYIIDQIDVGKFGSSITLMNAHNGEIVVEKTFSVALFHLEYAQRAVASSGILDLVTVLQALRQEAVKNLEAEHSQHYCGGNATVALFLSDNIPLAGVDRVHAVEYAKQLRAWVPDLRLIFASSSASEDAVAPMLQQRSDFVPVTLSATGDVATILSGVVNILKNEPRRVVNPLCGVHWTHQDSGTIGFDDYVDADGINLYRLSSNYFYENNQASVVRIQSTDLGPINVCYSRTNVFPRRNRTSSVVPSDVVCESAANSGMVEISLANACYTSPTIRDCPPLYVSVSSTILPGVPQCKDYGCRYPNDIKYLVIAHELGCFNGAKSNEPHLYIVSILLILFVFLQ